MRNEGFDVDFLILVARVPTFLVVVWDRWMISFLQHHITFFMKKCGKTGILKCLLDTK
jgi:hypothetical protein